MIRNSTRALKKRCTQEQRRDPPTRCPPTKANVSFGVFEVFEKRLGNAHSLRTKASVRVCQNFPRWHRLERSCCLKREKNDPNHDQKRLHFVYESAIKMSKGGLLSEDIKEWTCERLHGRVAERMTKRAYKKAKVRC